VQPQRRPQHLVAVPAHRRVVAPHLADAAVVLAPVLVPELEQLLGVVEEEARVVRARAAEHDGGRGHGGGGLADEVGAGVVAVDLVRLPRRGHVLGPLPAVVVGVAVADLGPQHVGLGVRLDEVVGAPLDGLQHVAPLAGGLDLVPELHGAPRQHGDRERHRQAELDVVAGVVVPAHQVHALLQPVGEPRVAAPFHALVVGEVARPLRLEVQEAAVQRPLVVEIAMAAGGRRKREQHEREHGAERSDHLDAFSPAVTCRRC